MEITAIICLMCTIVGCLVGYFGFRRNQNNDIRVETKEDTRDKVQLNTISNQNDNFTISNGGIKIPSNISKIKVSGSVFVNSPNSSGYCWAYICKNEINEASSIAGSLTSSSSGVGYFSSSIPQSGYFDVSEGDIIYLIGDSTCAGIARSGYKTTWLFIEGIN